MRVASSIFRSLGGALTLTTTHPARAAAADGRGSVRFKEGFNNAILGIFIYRLSVHSGSTFDINGDSHIQLISAHFSYLLVMTKLNN